MTDKDLERIAKLFELTLDARFDRISAKFDQIQASLEQVKSEITSELNQSLDSKYEELFHKLAGDGVGDVDPYPQIDQEYLNGMVRVWMRGSMRSLPTALKRESICRRAAAKR